MHTQLNFDELRPVACGESEADLLLVNGQVINVFTGEILKASVAVKAGYIAGVGDYRLGQKIVDLHGSFVLPGLIDSHIHIESSMFTPEAFARTAVPHGTTAVLADPHEIVNVLGMDGWRYMVDSSQGLPVDFFWQVPSCVPATNMETSGGTIGPTEVKQALGIFPQSPALAEMMNYPGVINGQKSVLNLIRLAHQMNLLIEGHAPGLHGYALNAYAAAGCSSDHECTTREETLEKLRLGFRILIREGSAARNLLEILPLINLNSYHRCCFCTDDRHPAHLLTEGHMDHILRKAVCSGFPAIQAIQMATINPALHYQLKARGAIAPGYLADLVIVDNLEDITVQQVYKQGRLVACDGKCLAAPTTFGNAGISSSVIIPNVEGQLRLIAPPGAQRVRVIEIIPGQILTRSETMSVQAALNDLTVSKLAVVEAPWPQWQYCPWTCKRFWSATWSFGLIGSP